MSDSIFSRTNRNISAIPLLKRGINLSQSKPFVTLLWLFLLVFPKGGFKIANIPITWGYLFLALLDLVVLKKSDIKIQIKRVYAIIFLIPFQFISLTTILWKGSENTGMALSFITSFFFIPYSFLFFLSDAIENLNINNLTRLIKKGVNFISVYGIVLFVFKQLTGFFIQIPFLTVNFGDLGTLEDKNISRGSVFKLISSYNNGNIYGVCVLMLLPLYGQIEKRHSRNLLVKLSLLLTLSRTVWIGLVFNEIITSLALKKSKSKALTKSITIIISSILFIVSLIIYYEIPWHFILDPTLGGRSTEQLDLFENFTFFAQNSFSGIYEIVYTGILHSFGVIGLISYFAGVIFPIVLFSDRSDPIKTSIVLGLTNYLFVSCSDGAALFIPTMAFYWFLLSLLARRHLKYNTI